MPEAGQNSSPGGLVRNLPPPTVEIEALRAAIASAGGRVPRELAMLVQRAIFDLWTTGYGETATARALGVSARVIRTALSKHGEFWRAYAGQGVDQHLGEQLARLDKTERELWQAWERSKYPEEKSRRKTATKGGMTVPGKDGQTRTVGERRDNETVVDARGRDGDPRYMALIVQTQKTRAALLGRLFAPKPGEGAMLGGSGRGEPIYPDELWGARDSLPQTTPLLEAFLADPSTLPNDGSGVPKPPDIDDPAYATPVAQVAAVVDIKTKRNGNGSAEPVDEDEDTDDGRDDDDDDFGFD